MLFLKDPDAKLDYSIDWSVWLDDDIIVGSTWDVDDGLTVDSDTFSVSNTTIWLSGGVPGRRYRATNRITTASGRVDDRTITINVVER